MRIVFMGTPEFAVESLKALVKSDDEVVAVFTRRDAPKNRGMKLFPPPVKVCAEENGIPVYDIVDGKYNGMPVVEKLSDGAVSDYLYVDGEYIHDPLPKPEKPEEQPSQLDVLEAQVTYTAMMTDTLLEV